MPSESSGRPICAAVAPAPSAKDSNKNNHKAETEVGLRLALDFERGLFGRSNTFTAKVDQLRHSKPKSLPRPILILARDAKGGTVTAARG